MELQRSCFNAYRMILDQTVIQEETMEGIVPDACPDMMRIIGSTGQVILKERELSEGSLRMGGTVRGFLLYMTDGEDSPRHVSLELPFACTVEYPKLNGGCKLHLSPRLSSVDAHALNPRKYLLRAEIAVEVQVYDAVEDRVASGVVRAEDEPELQQKTTEEDAYHITVLTERAFRYSEILDFRGNRGGVKELLQSGLELRGTEAKVIGGKLILKGEAELNVLCRGEDGTVFTELFSIPYSQVLEVNGVGEDCDTTVTCVLTDFDCSLQGGVSPSVVMSMELNAQAVVGETRLHRVLTDLYSTACTVETEYGEFSLDRVGEIECVRENVRQFCECGIPAKNVVDTKIMLGRVTHTVENGVCRIAADGNAVILFYSEDEALCSASFSVTIHGALPAADEQESVFDTIRIGKPTTLSVYGGFEVRFEVEFTGRTKESRTLKYVTGIKVLPDRKSELEAPSLVIRRVREEEELWDIAKANHSTVSDIMKVNKLEREQVTGGQMILIPRCR